MAVEAIKEMMNYLQNRITQSYLPNVNVEAYGPRADGVGHSNPSFTIKLDNGIIESQITVWYIGPADIGAFDRSTEELIIDDHVTIQNIQDIDPYLQKMIDLYT